MITVYGQIATDTGLAACSWLDEYGRLARGGYYAPADGYRTTQAREIPVDIDHDSDKTIGLVRYLERADRGLFAVAEVIDDAIDVEADWYFSAMLAGSYDEHTYDDVELLSVALVAASASVAKEPCTIVDCALEDRHWPSLHAKRAILERAADYHGHRRFRYGEPLRVADIRTQRTQPTRRVDDGRPVIHYSGGAMLGKILSIR